MSESTLTPPVGKDDHVLGSPDAHVTLVEYGDFECPYCGMAYPIVHSVQQELGAGLRLVFRNFPLKELHPHAQHAAEAAEAAGAQGKFWEMHDIMFAHQDALEDADLVGYAGDIGIDSNRVANELKAGSHSRKVRDQFKSGVMSGVNGTPTFFINGERFDGDWSRKFDFLRALSRELV